MDSFINGIGYCKRRCDIGNEELLSLWRKTKTTAMTFLKDKVQTKLQD